MEDLGQASRGNPPPNSPPPENYSHRARQQARVTHEDLCSGIASRVGEVGRRVVDRFRG